MEPVVNADPITLLKRLEDVSSQMTRLSGEFRKGVEELRESICKQSERFQREKDAAVLAARVEAQVAALQPDAGDSTLQPALDNDNQKKVRFGNFILTSIYFSFLVCKLQPRSLG